MSSTCPKCYGQGKIITDPCKICYGSGKIKKKELVKIHIPAGVNSGMRLKMSGYGDAGDMGAPSGDLYVHIEVEKSETFEREGDDVIVELPISFVEASLGCKKEVPTPLGSRCKISIPEGMQSGKILRVKENGFPNVHGQGTGDLLIRILVETPVHLNEKQKEILRSFEKLETTSNHPRKKSFLDKVKNLFTFL